MMMLLTMTSCHFSIYSDDSESYEKAEGWIIDTDGTGERAVVYDREAYLTPDNQKLRAYWNYDGIYESDFQGNRVQIAETPNLSFYSIASNRDRLIVFDYSLNAQYLCNGEGVLIKQLSGNKRIFSVFSFFLNQEWLWGYSYIESKNDYKIHLIKTNDNLELILSDSVGMGPPCFDYENTVYHSRSNGTNYSIIKRNLISNESTAILNSDSRYNLLFLTNDKQLLVYYVNSDLFTYNTVTNEVRQIYSFHGGYDVMFSHMMLHPLERKIFFIEGRSLKKLDLNNCQITVLRQGNVDFASLSPDGSRIYFVTNTKVEGKKE